MKNKFLLDTHIFIWWLTGNKKLNDSIREIIADPQNQIMVSVATAWEMSIKHRKGKLFLKTTIKTSFAVSGFEALPITLDHVLRLDKLPPYHNDPFDRLLIAQAQEERYVLITDDPKIKKYKVSVFE